MQSVHQALLREGVSSRVVTSNLKDRTSRLDQDDMEAGVRLVPMLFFARWRGTVGPAFPSPAAIPRIVREVRNADVVHIHGWRNLLNFTSTVIALLFRRKVIVQPHGARAYDGGRLRLKRLFDKSLGDRVLERASLRLALSQREMNDLSTVRSSGNIKIANPAPFDPVSTLGEVSKDRVVFLGRLTRTKGVDLLIEAFAEVHRNDESMRLDIVGPDDGEMSNLQRQADNLGLSAVVSFRGRLGREQIKEVLLDRPIVVVPSRSDVFGVVILEAAAFGCPLAVSNRIELIDEIRDSVIPFDPEPSSIANAILEAAEQADALGRRSLELVARYDPRLVTRQLIDSIYKLGPVGSIGR